MYWSTVSSRAVADEVMVLYANEPDRSRHEGKDERGGGRKRGREEGGKGVLKDRDQPTQGQMGHTVHHSSLSPPLLITSTAAV